MMIDIGFATYDIPQIMHPEALVVTVAHLICKAPSFLSYAVGSHAEMLSFSL